VAPQTKVVFGSLRNIARFSAITRLSTKLIPKVFALAAGGSSLPKPLAFFQAPLNRSGEYQRPPSTKADAAAARTAQRSECESSWETLLTESHCHALFIPVDGAADEAAMQSREKLSVADGEILIRSVPFVALFPSRLGELH
jgi:hypothetical protein